MMPQNQNRNPVREECYRSLLALACYYPQLLDEGLDEPLAMAEFSEGWISQLRDAVLGCALESEEVRNELSTHMKAVVGETSWRRFLKDVAMPHLPRALLAQSCVEGGIGAMALRQHLENRLELLHLEEEHGIAEANLARTMDEREWKHLEVLRLRLQELRHHSDFFPEKDAQS